MFLGARGLSQVSTNDLRALYRALHRGELSCPVDPLSLAVAGLLRLKDDVDVLHGLDEAGVRAVLVSVIAERR